MGPIPAAYHGTSGIWNRKFPTRINAVYPSIRLILQPNLGAFSGVGLGMSSSDLNGSGSGVARSQGPRLLDQVRERVRRLGLAVRTERAYVDWVRRFILFHAKQHPAGMGAPEVEAFLSHAATGQKASGPNGTDLSAEYSHSPCVPRGHKGEGWGEGNWARFCAAALRSPQPALRATFSRKGRRERSFALPGLKSVPFASELLRAVPYSIPHCDDSGHAQRRLARANQTYCTMQDRARGRDKLSISR